MKRVVISLFFIILTVCSIAQEVNQVFRAQQILDQYGEVNLMVEASRENFKKLQGLTSIELHDEELLLNTNAEEFQQFLNKDIEFKVFAHKRAKDLLPTIDYNSTKSKSNWNYYPSYSAYLQIMNDFVLNYPELCQLHVFDTLQSGRLLLALEISDSVNIDEAEPEVFYTGTMHGDETAGFMVLIQFIDELLTNYGSNAQITSLVNSTELYINPLANPDGTYAGGNSTVSGAIRRNANGVDLNRNFHDPQDGPHPDGNAWQEETVAFMDFATERSFVSALNFHGGAELFNYPWDTWSQLSADDSWWVMVGNEYADTAQAASPNGYFDDYGSGVINGYVWYTTNGNRQDYMNYFHHCREATLEMTNTKLYPASGLENVYQWNRNSLLNFAVQASYGIHGLVKDSLSDQPLRAFIEILNHDVDSSQVYSSLPIGDYHRPIYTGVYDIKASATGYHSKIVSSVNVVNNTVQIVDFELVPLNSSIVEEEPHELLTFQDGDFLYLKELPEGVSEMRLYNIEGKLERIEKIDFNQKYLSSDINSLPSGIYLLRLLGTDKVINKKVNIQ